MKEIIWKICLLLLGVSFLFAYISHPGTQYEARYSAYLRCAGQNSSAICAQLFGN